MNRMQAAFEAHLQSDTMRPLDKYQGSYVYTGTIKAWRDWQVAWQLGQSKVELMMGMLQQARDVIEAWPAAEGNDATLKENWLQTFKELI